ncbi:uncharacterized protein IUM83_05049 [Phytophthora cinnamomi]|uniref:uncharacterized protein n=1 Tax=Phytophthora cinnamomi TaxID=4785 RepID=UPI003559F8A4|nr:hypothetical protein IUM83_05049 [Phytophthora cinnamomi]
MEIELSLGGLELTTNHLFSPGCGSIVLVIDLTVAHLLSVALALALQLHGQPIDLGRELSDLDVGRTTGAGTLKRLSVVQHALQALGRTDNAVREVFHAETLRKGVGLSLEANTRSWIRKVQRRGSDWLDNVLRSGDTCHPAQPRQLVAREARDVFNARDTIQPINEVCAVLDVVKRRGGPNGGRHRRRVRCEGLKSVNDRRGPAGDVAEGVCNASGGVKAAVLTDVSVVVAEGGVIDVQELVVLPNGGCEAGSAGAERGAVEADAGVAGDMLEAAEDVVEPVCALVEVADDTNALVEVAVALNTEAEAVGVLPEAANVLLVVVDTLPEVVGAAGESRDPASCPPPPCDGHRWNGKYWYEPMKTEQKRSTTAASKPAAAKPQAKTKSKREPVVSSGDESDTRPRRKRVQAVVKQVAGDKDG